MRGRLLIKIHNSRPRLPMIQERISKILTRKSQRKRKEKKKMNNWQSLTWGRPEKVALRIPKQIQIRLLILLLGREMNIVMRFRVASRIDTSKRLEKAM